jgi:tetratricopeptide (TPR) repeat protein
MAFVGKAQLGNAEKELESLKSIAANDTLKEVTIWDINTTQELMQIASRILEGEIAARSGNFDEAVGLLREAIGIENELAYNEPPDWFFPVRHNLGAILLQAEQPVEAEEIYREDLKEFPQNGWSLFGLWQSLKAQNRESEAAEVKKKFEKAWKYADIKLQSSRIF